MWISGLKEKYLAAAIKICSFYRQDPARPSGGLSGTDLWQFFEMGVDLSSKRETKSIGKNRKSEIRKYAGDYLQKLP